MCTLHPALAIHIDGTVGISLFFSFLFFSSICGSEKSDKMFPGNVATHSWIDIIKKVGSKCVHNSTAWLITCPRSRCSTEVRNSARMNAL